MMDDDSIIAVVTAHKEGKKIQARIKKHDAEWIDVISHEPDWNFYECDYRVAYEPRKPREWICFLASDGTITPINSPITPALLVAAKTIRVREVLE